MRKITLLFLLFICFGFLKAQTSPDFIFGTAGADWTAGVQGTEVASGVYQWKFTASADGDQYFKLGEAAAITDGSGFWTNSAAEDLKYTGVGAMWDAYHKANMNDGGAISFSAVNARNYVIHARKVQGDSKANFAIFESPSEIATIASVSQEFTAPNLVVTVNASVAPDAVQKFWVRYTKDGWATSAIAEAVLTGTSGTVSIDATGTDKIEYYAFTTVQAPADFTDFDFYAVSLNNNGGKNYFYYEPLAGNYYMPNIPEGEKGFTSLSEAVATINAAGLAGDVNFLISGDITEAANIGLAINTGSHKITIRPDKDEDRVITFTRTADNKSPSGHFVIGYKSLTESWADANTIATNNVTIDGYADGGTTRRLKFTTASGSLAGSKLIVIVGACENTTIKNSIVVNNSWGGSAQGIGMIARKGAAIEVAPKGVLIENNIITSIASGTGQGINTTSSGTLTTFKTTGLVVKNNVITAQGRVGWFYYCDGGDFIGNELRLTQTGSAGTVNYGLWFGTGVAGTFNIKENQIILVTTNEASASGNFGTRALSLAGGVTYNIHNNTFAGMDRLKLAGANVNQCYIFVQGTTDISHNTFYLPALTEGSTPGYFNAIQMYNGETTTVMNNIFVANDDNKAVLMSAPANVSDYNLFYLKGGNTNARIVGAYATLEEYQATGKDVNSVYQEVFFADEAAGDLRIVGTSVNDPDLSAPAIAGITTDIFGTSRFSPLVYKGAHEASDLNQPAPTKVFTVQAPVGTEKVYVAGSFTGKYWDSTTPLELTPTANPYEFTGTFACADNVEYKYLNGIGSFDYVEATAPATELSTNRGYNAADNVPYWNASPKVKFNVSFGEGFIGNIPEQLFVKGSWDNWTEAVELTKSSTPLTAPASNRAPGASNEVVFTGSIGDGVSDKIFSNAEYKYLTFISTDENWEVSDNRKAVYPLMNDVIANFEVNIGTGVEQTSMDVKVLRTPSGISVQFDGEADVELYTTSGQLIEKTRISNVYNRDLDRGNYIIRVNGKSQKFVR